MFIIGAGPGDPGLISARGVRLLSEATVVVYDRAVERVLRWARPDAERIAAGAPAERETAQDALSMLLAEKARDGHTVARLKWGDAYVFDSGAKEALFLHEQGVSFEVVPGIPAAIGTTAYAGIPVTYPGAGDALVLIRGQEDEAGRLADLDWDAIARIDGTLVCYAGARLVPAILQALLEHGMPGDTSASLIRHGTLPGQITACGTLQELLDHSAVHSIGEASLLVIGEVINLRDHLRWFDERPLFGRRVIVTRSQEQSGELLEALENLGALPILAPTYRMLPPEDAHATERAVVALDSYDWVVFEGASAVTRFLSALTRSARDLRAFGYARICAVGASTTDRLLASGLKPDITMPEASGENVGESMNAIKPVADARVLVVRPDHLRAVVAEDLTRRGATVTDLIAYRTTPAPTDSPVAQELYRLLLDGRIDAVTFTSPSAVRRFSALIGKEQAADLLNTIAVATIGPVTAAAATELGVESPLVPETYTVDGMIQALVEHLQSARPSANGPQTANHAAKS